MDRPIIKNHTVSFHASSILLFLPAPTETLTHAEQEFFSSLFSFSFFSFKWFCFYFSLCVTIKSLWKSRSKGFKYDPHDLFFLVEFGNKVIKEVNKVSK